MKLNFTIGSLLAMYPTLGYNVAFGNVINKLISAKDKDSYNISLKEATKLALGYEIETPYEVKDYGINPNSPFAGVPLFQPLTLKTEDESDLLLDSAVVTWSRQKNLVKTIVQGRDSSVKELINNGDYLLNVSGIICSKTWLYPLDQVVIFERFMAKKLPLKIEHEVLNAIGIYDIVIETHDCPKAPHINCQQYSFTASSEDSLQLKIFDNKDYFKM